MLLRTLVLTACIGFALLPTPPTWADEKIVSDVTIEYPQQPDEPRHVSSHLKFTVCYQDTKARVEADDGTVVLYDLKAGTTYWLHPDRQTFSVQPMGQFPTKGPASDWSHLLLEHPVPQSTVQTRPSADKKTIGGVDATRLLVTGDVQLADATPAQQGYHLEGFPGGGVGGGGQAGGGFGSGPNLGQGPNYGGGLGQIPVGAGSDTNSAGDTEESDDHTSTLHLEGELWVANLPLAAAPLMSQSLPPAPVTLPMLLPLCSKLPGQDVPLEGRVTLKFHFTPHTSEREKLPSVMVVAVQLKSMQEGPLPHSLFYPPAGYSQDNAGPSLMH